MSRWRNLNQWIFDINKFYHQEGLQLYLWILLNTMYEGGVQLGCVVLGERLYMRAIRKFREDLFYKVRIWPFCKWFESEKYKYGRVYTFKKMNDLACGDYFYWIGMSVKKVVIILGLICLIIKPIHECLRAAKSM
ncbi:hypothetical protein [Rossellomorea aquimaris]|uniref:Uncharacterized protein n=1 Tax=Rossellomorea aquimaris TaxID=189382 RepID=A0A5D4UIY9_9BACI|nr:hypothetical protein [Rossellomorea aquimaris]TYS75654.1 hypothetical protein FZD05_20100 [Rossellomorea aquimaris]TYS87223.1 hypothetical protein FZC85_09640 [Rossellomorea aquimaris]